MMLLHFNWKIMLYVLYQRYIQTTVEIREGGTNFTRRVSKASSLGKIFKDPDEEKKKGMLCREYKWIMKKHSMTLRKPRIIVGMGRRWEIGLWGKTKICLNPSLPLLATWFWEMNKTSWMLNFIISKTGTVISNTEITFIN